MANVTEALDQLIQVVDKVAAGSEETPTTDALQPAVPRDAIDEALQRPARETQVVSLADSPVMAAFRAELSDGLIRIDTLNQVLRLITRVIERWPAA